MSSIGIYPGTFDPIHDGHIAFAQTTIEVCELDEIILIPEAMPRGKKNVTDINIRSSNIAARIAAIHKLRSVNLVSSQFSVHDSLPEIRKLASGAALTLLIGSDVAMTLQSWSNVAELLAVCQLAIGMRSGQTDTEIRDVITKLEHQLGIAVRYTIVTTEHAGVASSQFRKR